MSSTPAGAPLIVTATFGKDDFSWLQGLRKRHFPPERNQVPAHLTLFHHLPPSLESELRYRLGGVTGAPPPRAEISGIMDLGQGTAFRVASEELEAVRADLAEAFRGMLTPQDQAGWRPHVTIQNKVSRQEAVTLQNELKLGVFPRPLVVAGLASWRYLGGPWEAIRTHPFRR